MNKEKLISLSHREIISYGDEYISINIANFKYFLYCVLASTGYILVGLNVGWSSRLPMLDEKHEFDIVKLTRDEISWIVSVFPLTIFFAALGFCHLYYWLNSKVLMLIASFCIPFSWILLIFYNKHSFYILLTARIFGGFGSAIILIIIPLYMKDIRGLSFNISMVDLLITQFGLGICIQYFFDSTSLIHISIISMILSLSHFIICCLIPESPNYKFYHHVSLEQSSGKRDEKLRNFYSKEDLQPNSIKDLFIELERLNLTSLIGLVIIEQLIGGISILFYMKYFAQTTGGKYSTEWISKTVGLTLVLSIPIAKLTKFSSIPSTRKQIIISSTVIITCMTILGVICIMEGITGHKMAHNIRQLAPIPIFATVTFFHVAGITRNLWILMQQIFSSFTLELYLRVLCTSISWLTIFGITKTLPKLLYLVGVGYFYAYSVIFMIISVIYLIKVLPNSLISQNIEVRITSNSLSTSSIDVVL